MRKEKGNNDLIKKSTLNTIMGLSGKTMDFMIDFSFYADKLNREKIRQLKKELIIVLEKEFDNDFNRFIESTRFSEEIIEKLSYIYNYD